jgi:zinc protease
MLDRKTPPPFAHTTSFDLIHPSREKLANGTELFIIPGGSQDVMKIEVIFYAGRWYESIRGASYFSGNLLTKGTADKSSFQIAQHFDRYGAHIEIHPGLDFVSVSAYTLSQYLSPVLELFIEILSKPVFPEKELEQHKAIYIQNLKVNEEKTSFLATKAFRKKLFGDHHPYGREVEEHDVAALGQKTLVDHFLGYYRKPLVFVSGKIEGKSQELLRAVFSATVSGERKDVAYQTPAAATFQEEIEKDGSVQASIRAGKKFVMRKHRDYHRAIFVAHVLGGYFGSRLMKNIREEKGLTYGIYASPHPLQHESFLVIGADVNKENVGVTLNEIRKELKTLRTEKISAEELETAKNHFIGSLQAEITTPFAHADKIKTIVLSDLPFDFYGKMISEIDQITPEKIIQTSDAYFHEDTFSSVAVG